MDDYDDSGWFWWLLIGLAVYFFVLRDDPEDRYDSGYSDGYATGWNTTCQIRATMIEEDWDSESYSEGYRDGYAQGSIDCQKEN